MRARAAFIVLEGGEGAGKTSVLGALTDALRAANYDVLTTREPGGTAEGLALRTLLLSSDGLDWDQSAEMLLMVAARIQHVKRVIVPALADGSVVLCDRFVGSTLAYQGSGRGIDRELIVDLHRRLVGGVMPDLTVLLDVEPRLGLARSVRRLETSRQNEGRFEALQVAFHERVRAGFLAQAAAAPDAHVVVDANREMAVVAGEVTERVLTWLTGRKRQ